MGKDWTDGAGHGLIRIVRCSPTRAIGSRPMSYSEFSLFQEQTMTRAFSGQFSSDSRISGRLNGSGFNNDAFELNRE